MRIIVTLLLAFTAALAGSTARAGENGGIELFPFGIDPITGSRTIPDFGNCEAEVTLASDGRGRLSFGVYARLSGATLLGFAVAELYLQGIETNTPGQLPDGWSKTITIPTGAFAVGLLSDPSGQQEVRRGFVLWSVGGPEDPDCQNDPLALIAIVDLISGPGFGTNFPNNYYISVVAGVPPGNSTMPCPLVGICNAPNYTLYCMSGGQLIVNPMGISCTVATEQSTWSHVKGLYR